MENHNYFFKIEKPVSQEFINSLKELITNSSESQWQKKFDFERLTLSSDIFKNEILIYNLIEKFNCNKRLSIFKWSANSAYDWHTDPMRNASVNLLLEGWNSLCLFGKPNLENSNDQNIKNLKVLNYSDSNFFVLNTTEYHSVINFDNPRYLVSICIPHPYTFEEVIEYLKENE